jgi:ParB family chromosome partitioning protein
MARKKVELRQLVTLPLEQITAPAATHRHSPAEVERLARTIAEEKEAPPLLVRDNGRGTCTVVTGGLIYEAAARLEWPELDCIVVGPECDKELRVIERLHQDHAEPWDLADALQSLKKRYGWTQAQIGLAIGRTRDFVANLLSITQIAPDVRRLIRHHDQGDELSARHLRYVARTPRAEQVRVAQRILEQTLSTKALERERRVNTLRAQDSNLIKVRALRPAGSGLAPRNAKEWRRYHRQLVTDLRRIDRQESLALRRAYALMSVAKQRLRLIRVEANRKRRSLGRELQQVKKQLLHAGG